MSPPIRQKNQRRIMVAAPSKLRISLSAPHWGRFVFGDLLGLGFLL